MNDKQTNIQEMKDFVQKFVKDREWNQFHNAKSLSIAIAVEAAELMEHFMWCTNEEANKIMEDNRQEIETEVADIMITLLCLCNAYNVDLASAAERKMVINKEKYPVEKAKGRWTKYNKL